MPDERKAISLLKKVNLFGGVADAAIARLAQKMEVFAGRRRRVIYLPGDPGNWIYFVHGGRVKISKVTRDGKELTLAHRVPGEFFGELCLIDGGPREEMAEVVEAAVVGQVERKLFQEVVSANPGLNWRLVRALCERRRELEYKVEFLMFKDVDSKLAELLLKLSEEYGAGDPRGNQVPLKITHQEMANLIGSTRETVSLTLSQFRRKGLVRSDGRKVIVLDREGLRVLA